MALTHIQGPDTAVWKRESGAWLDLLNLVHDNIEDVFTQWLAEFRSQYANSQGQKQARQKLANHKMTFPNVDPYVNKFEDLCQLAGYTVGNEETLSMFIDGLDLRILNEVLRVPVPNNYQDIKQRAVDATKASLLVEAICARCNQGNNRFSTQRNFQSTFGQARPQRPFFLRNTQQGGTNQFNSSNTPRWMNNRPVPMDIGGRRETPNPNWRNPRNAANAAIASGPRTFQGNCYHCGKPGHMA